MDMTAYLHQSIEIYNAIPDALPLRANVHYPHHEPSNSEINSDLDKPGVMGKHSASLLMKLLYCARMARPDLCYAVNHLARYVTKWNMLKSTPTQTRILQAALIALDLPAVQ